MLGTPNLVFLATTAYNAYLYR